MYFSPLLLLENIEVGRRTVCVALVWEKTLGPRLLLRVCQDRKKTSKMGGQHTCPIVRVACSVQRVVIW